MGIRRFTREYGALTMEDGRSREDRRTEEGKREIGN